MMMRWAFAILLSVLWSTTALALYCPNYEDDCSTPSVAGTNPSVEEWQDIFSLVSGGPAAWGSLAPGVQDLTRGCGIVEEPHPVPARFPIEVLKAIAMHESSWTQFCVPNVNQSGGPARTIISFDCGYGVGQVTSGMRKTDATPDYDRSKVASDALYNMAVGTRILASKWQSANCVGDRNPDIIEDWYAAIWAYNGFSVINNPNHPNYAPNRGVWDPSVNNPAPYQEKIFGRMEHPPSAAYWDPIQVAYPDISEIAAANGKPGALSEPSCASPTNCSQKRPVHLTATALGTQNGQGLRGNGAIAVVVGHEDEPTRLFAKATDGTLYVSTYAQPQWSSWTRLAHGAACGFDVAKRRGMQHSTEVFAPTTNGSSLRYALNDDEWGPVASFGGSDISDFQTLAWTDGRLDVFVLGGDKKIYRRTESLPHVWDYWFSLDGQMRSGPSAIIDTSNRPHLFATDTSGTIWHRRWSSTAMKWEPWTSVWGSDAAGRPIPQPRADGSVDVLVRRADNKLLWGRYATDEIQSMVPIFNGEVHGNPTTVVDADDTMWVFARDENERLLAGVYDGSTWSTVPLPQALSETKIASDPYAWIDEQIVHVAIIDEAHHMQVTSFQNNSWQPWQSLSDQELDGCITDQSNGNGDNGNGDNGNGDNGNGDNGNGDNGNGDNGNGDNGNGDNGNGDNGQTNPSPDPEQPSAPQNPSDSDKPSWGDGTVHTPERSGCMAIETASPVGWAWMSLLILAWMITRRRSRFAAR